MGNDMQIVWDDGERSFFRGCRSDENGIHNVLVARPALAGQKAATFDRFTHEFNLKEDLDAAWALRPRELVHEEGQPLLVFDDPGGESLTQCLGTPIDTADFLRMAISIAVALEKLHRTGLIHQDIKPAHILINCYDGQARLTGFGLTSRLLHDRQPSGTVAGTLAYMAPEQTGRLNSSVDSRSDLYSLGVTFYQLLTGALPFTADGPLEWMHCHIAKQPVTPSHRIKSVSAVLSAIVMKLMEKTSEDRYQTAASVEHDLRRCLAEWQSQRRISEFVLGEHGSSDRLLIPEKLYGREREVAALVAALGRSVESLTPELILVSGYSGVGKSSLVNEFGKVLVPQRALFAYGKFDSYHCDVPYAALTQAFRNLVRMLLGRSDSELANWREALHKALGSDAQLMSDVIPELKLIIGEVPPLAEIEPEQTRQHFMCVFQRFIGVFAQGERPLVLFLDDLQWLDVATLDLFETLLIQSNLPHLMLIGAYRNDEAGAKHPLTGKLLAIRNAGVKIEEITLPPLAKVHIEQMIAESLSGYYACIEPLTDRVLEKTAGNPLSIIQFLKALAREQSLSFDHDSRQWRWHPERAQGDTDNVVSPMADKTIPPQQRVHPLLRTEALALNPTSTIVTPAEHLDLATVLKVSQAVSGEIVHDKLVDMVMRTAIEQAGAERGVLILTQAGHHRIVAQATARDDTTHLQLHDLEVSGSLLPEAVLNHVLRTGESLALDDALAEPTFAADPYIHERRARSILCVPLINQGKFTGALYLENNLIARVFTPGRIAVLKLVASQASGSLENAQLYCDVAKREAKIRRLIDANVIGIIIWDMAGQILEANDAFLRMVGYTREDLVSGGMHWKDLTPPEMQYLNDNALLQVLESGYSQPYEKVHIRKDGSRVPIIIGVATFEGSRQEGVAFVMDLTERKQAEAKVQEGERRYREVQSELAHANRVATMGQLVASIAHEVSQPIAAAVTNSHAALRWLGAQPPELDEARLALSRLINDANRAADVMDRIRRQIRKAPPQKESLEINATVREMVDFTRGEISRSASTVQVRLAEGLPSIQGDRVELHQVLLNLIINALDAMNDVSTDRRHLEISSDLDDTGKVLVQVRDSGPGFGTQNPEQIFAAFYSTKSKGLGMGLSICRSIIEAHGGRLWAEKNVPHGAVFRFQLPANVPA